jgi:phage recombination protein Bet
VTTELELANRDTGQAVATYAAGRSEIALRPDQTEWTSAQVAALRQLGIEDATEGDLQVFFHVCQSSGLDPFRKQIYMIGRKTKVKYWDESQRRQVEDWVMKFTIQTGIDGFRRNGREAAKREGAAIRVDGPYWQGADGGGWQDVWLSNQPPAAAKFVIFRDGEAHTGIAMYREFVQTIPGGNSPNSMWAKMPANQLAKCAEAQAWRRAYPDDFSGMQLEDAAQIIDPDGRPDPVRGTVHRASAGEILGGQSAGGGAVTSGMIRSWPGEQKAEEGSTPVVSAEATENPVSDSGKPKRRTKKADLDEIRALMDRIPDLGTADNRLAFVRTVFNDHEIAGPDNLTPEQRSYLLTELRGVIAEQEGRDTVADATDMEGTEQAEAAGQ